MRAAALSGIHFASEIFIVIGLLSCAPARFGHHCTESYKRSGDGLDIGATFGSVGTKLEICIVRKASVLFAQIEDKFAHKIAPLVGTVVFMSFFDSTLLQFLPWRATIVQKESNGFPTVSMWRWAYGTQILQFLGSVAIQSAFLAGIGASITNPSITL